jgi:hypothetical protein
LHQKQHTEEMSHDAPIPPTQHARQRAAGECRDAASRRGHPSAVIATPGTGVPIAGGLIDSVVGIITGTLYGISGATRAVACSIAPACPPLPARHARRARHQ